MDAALPPAAPAWTAVIFDRFGPYHLARLEAAARLRPILALEVCGESREYAWDPVEAVGDGENFRRLTLFPGRDHAQISPSECARGLTAVLDHNEPGAVAVPGWASPAALAALGWGARRGRPVVVMSESTAHDEPRRAWKEAVKRRVLRQCGAGLAGGGPQRDYLVALGLPADRVFTGYDAVDNAHFERGADAARAEAPERRAALGLPARYFLASARFVEKKNLPRLLEAFAAYRQGAQRAGGEVWDLVLLGDGPLRPVLEQRRADLGLRDCVHLPGFRQYPELPAFLGLAGAFVHPSTTEQWGLVVNEALAAGLPVLVSNRCGCAPDLVAEGVNGWTFTPEDTSALTDGLHRLASMTDEERARMGREGRRRVAGWSPTAFAEGLSQAVNAAGVAGPARIGPGDRLLLRLLLARGAAGERSR